LKVTPTSHVRASVMLVLLIAENYNVRYEFWVASGGIIPILHFIKIRSAVLELTSRHDQVDVNSFRALRAINSRELSWSNQLECSALNLVVRAHPTAVHFTSYNNFSCFILRKIENYVLGITVPKAERSSGNTVTIPVAMTYSDSDVRCDGLSRR
jgi:hypothetical protein